MSQAQECRGPHNRAKCPFYVVPENPLSAEISISKCVDCVTFGNAQLACLREDLCQIALLTVIEDTPKYDPAHPSGASYITYMKSRVCTRLWSERKKELRYKYFSHEDTDTSEPNLLVSRLIEEACQRESEADIAVRRLEVEMLRKHLPQIMSQLSDKEHRVLQLKYFQELTGVEIAKVLGISQGRVSQLVKTALGKARKAYLHALDKNYGNFYHSKN